MIRALSTLPLAGFIGLRRRSNHCACQGYRNALNIAPWAHLWSKPSSNQEVCVDRGPQVQFVALQSKVVGAGLSRV